MAAVKKEIEVAKEVSDVLALVVHIVAEAKAKKPASEIASGSVSKLIDAISGVDQIGQEAKDNRKAVLNAAALSVAELVEVLLA